MLESPSEDGTAYLMRLRCDEDAARAIADLMVETYDPSEAAASAFEESFDAKSWSSKSPWIVEIYFGFVPNEEGVRALVAAVAGEALAAQAEFTSVSQDEWVAASFEGLEAVREGRFVIHGRHAREAVRRNDIGIEIEAALAFGTGHHGSTRGCLSMLNRVARRRRPRAILDVGTGSAVLAIAAARLFRCRVEAGDIDPIAVASAAGNAQANGVGPLVKPVCAVGAAHPRLQAGAPYDLIFANILAGPLRALAPKLEPLLAFDGAMILSGLLASDVPGVLSAYRSQGVYLKARCNIEGWAALLLGR